jgi:spore coat protein A
MIFSRRTLLGAGAVAGAGLMLPLRIATTANATVPLGVTPFTEALPTLSHFGVIDVTTGTPATIEMITTTHKFHSALAATPTFAYRSQGGAQDYLGPVIVAKQGVPFNLTVKNSLGAHPLASAIDPALVPAGTDDANHPRASVHLHGGNTEVRYDGGPLDTFLPGSSKTYTHGNTQEATGLWYHDHSMGITRLNVFAGLAAGYLIRNNDDPGDGKRLPGAPYEVPLVLQDRMFNADGTFNYPANSNASTPRPWAPEFFGDVATVNGKAWPNLDVARGKYRFRVYNGSNARFYNLRLVSDRKSLTFHQIGSDGGLLNAPVPLRELLLAPAERADLVVDFADLKPGTRVVLTNDAAAPFPAGLPTDSPPLPQIMAFTVTSAHGWTRELPERLRETRITRLAGRRIAATRSMTLVEIHDSSDDPLMVLVNNRNFDTTERTTVRKDTLEQWDLINTTVDAHPMHLHFTQFQILNRQKYDVASYVEAAYGAQPVQPNTGSSIPVDPYLLPGTTTPPPNERGWKDTVLAMPGEVTRILVPFGANAVPGKPMAIQASHTGEYVWHCHIVEHEDNDMMQRFVIK